MAKTFHYCAFCRTPKYVYSRTSLSFFTFLLLFLASALCSYGIRKQFDEYVFAMFFSLLVLAELSVKIRYRISLRCKECGFDPIVYKRSPSMASQRVKEKLAERAADPKSLLKAQLQLPKISSERKLFWEQLSQKQSGGAPLVTSFEGSKLALSQSQEVEGSDSKPEISSSHRDLEGRLLSKQIH